MKTVTFFAMTCPTCCRAADSPFRSHDAQGHIVSGCVDHFHTGHLVAISESNRWHNRPAAVKIRAASKAGRLGGVTERAA